MQHYTNSSVVNSVPGYVSKAVLAPISWFDYVAVPEPDGITIHGRHELKPTEGFIECYVLPDSIEGAGESYGTGGSLNMSYRPKFFVPGDGTELYELLQSIRNEPMVLLLTDPTEKFLLQFGSELSPLYFSKVNAGTKENRGYLIECGSANRYFYNTAPTFEQIFRSRARHFGYPIDEFNGTVYEATHGTIKSKFGFLMPALAYTTNYVYGLTARLSPVRVPFERNSAASYYDAEGLLRIAAANIPRLDRDPVTLSPKGYLLSPAGENLILNSEPAAAGGSVNFWGNYSVDHGTVAPVGMFGDIKEYRFSESADSGNTIHRLLYGAGTPSASQQVTQTISLQIKADGRSIVCITAGAGVVFDLVAGAILNTGIYSAFKQPGTIRPVADGWVEISCTVSDLGNSVFWSLETMTGGTSSYIGDGISGVLIRRIQIEAGDFVTSYMPNFGVAVPRAADIISFDQAQARSFVPAGSATTWLDATIQNDLLDKGVFGLGFLPEASLVHGSAIDTDDLSYENDYLTEDIAGNDIKVADQYNAATIKEYANGTVTVNTGYVISTDISGFYIRTDAVELNLKNLALFPAALLNAELISITS